MQTKPRPDAKRWWSANLNIKKKNLNRLKNLSFKFHAIANHFSHMLRSVSHSQLRLHLRLSSDVAAGI